MLLALGFLGLIEFKHEGFANSYSCEHSAVSFEYENLLCSLIFYINIDLFINLKKSELYKKIHIEINIGLKNYW